MKDIIKYISIIAALCGFFSCSLKEDFTPACNEDSVEFIARLTGFNNVDVATKSDPTADFETAVYTAYLLIFDKSTGDRIAFESVDVTGVLISQAAKCESVESALACFIANVPYDFAEGITTIDGLNSAVLPINYATYSEAGGYLGVPKITVDRANKLCIPMFGHIDIDKMTNRQQFEIPVKRLFAKVSVELKLDVTFEGDWDTAFQTYTNYELNEYKLHNLPNKVRLVETLNSESPWKDGKDNPNVVTPSQSPDISKKIYNTGSSASGDKSYSFDCYVPEFYLNSIENPTKDQRYKPKNHPDGTYPIYLELVGQYNAYSITSTDINYKVYLGNDNVLNFSLARNTHYKNYLTIKGTTNNDKSEVEENLDHRVTTSTINNPVAKAGKSANCYVINATGEYNFPAYKGAFNDLSDAVLCNNQTAKELVILANDNYNNIVLTDYAYDPDRNLVTFKVTKVANGNVVLGLKNKDGSLEWSWHLWFNREFNAGALGQWAQINTQNMPNGTDKMIDRNLGASPNVIQSVSYPGAATGNYYKYGHRAPYFTDNRESGNGATYHGYKESDYSSWNTTDKSPTDPCPPGYRVPASSVWSTNVGSTHGTLASAFLYWDSDSDIYYPYSEWLLSTGGLNENQTEYIPFEEGYTFESTGSQGTAVLNLGFLGKHNVRALAKDEFTIIDMKIQASKKEGRVWGNDGYFYYKHNALNLSEIFNGGLDALRAKLQINEYTQKRKVVKEYKVNASMSELRKILQMITSGSITDAFLESIADWGEPQPVNPPVMKENDINALLGQLILLDRENIDQVSCDISTDPIDRSEGYQVRCVKEKEQDEE